MACFAILVRHPSSVPGFARSTFPVGEGFLRRGNYALRWKTMKKTIHKLYLVHKNKIRSLAAADLATKKEERKMKKMKKSYSICLYCTNQM